VADRDPACSPDGKWVAWFSDESGEYALHLRAPDGLALSSRNQYLTKTERGYATAIHKSLTQAAEKIRNGIDPQKAMRAASRSLTTLGFKVDYVTARNAETLAVPQSHSGEPLRLLAAAWIGKTRLIDNIEV
jgi:pantoate--beta-alanine ligase